MSQQLAAWYQDQGEYVTGALFGLVSLDLFMFLVHCILERTTDGYNLTTLVITSSFFAVALIERLYSQQEDHH